MFASRKAAMRSLAGTTIVLTAVVLFALFGTAMTTSTALLLVGLALLVLTATLRSVLGARATPSVAQVLYDAEHETDTRA